MKEKILIRIYIPGGILSPGDFRKILMTAHYFGAEDMHFGSRQELLFYIDEKYHNEIRTRLQSIQYAFEVNRQAYGNIVSSYPSKNILPSVSWLTEGIYHEILSSFLYQPRLKINITDPSQGLVPLFTGDLNFIASEFDNYWYLYLRLDIYTKPQLWPVLVDGNEISELSRIIEDLTGDNIMSVKDIQEMAYKLRSWNFRIMSSEPLWPVPRFPYYEGFHQYGERFWLGVCSRENKLSVPFLESLCILCAQTSTGSLCLTPWKSLMIKNIAETDIPLWENLLGKYGISTGHAAAELNWQLPDLDQEAISLKQFIVRHFEKEEARTEGLSFGILTRPADLSASVIIERKTRLKIGSRRFFNYFNIRYKKDFNPNSVELLSFADGVKKRDVPEMLLYLCNKYYEMKSTGTLTGESEATQEKIKEEKEELKVFHRCSECLTVYSPEHGDEQAGVYPGTPFEALSEKYSCPVCESKKGSFEEMRSKA